MQLFENAKRELQINCFGTTYSHQKKSARSQPKYLFSTLREWFICVPSAPSAQVSRRKRLLTDKHQMEESERTPLFELFYLATDFQFVCQRSPSDSTLCKLHTQLISSGGPEQLFRYTHHSSSTLSLSPRLEFVYSPSGSSSAAAHDQQARRRRLLRAAKSF